MARPAMYRLPIPITLKAAKHELESLAEHFEGVGFPQYSLLNEDCKRHLMGVLDSQSLIRLGMCSKTEQRLAARCPLKIFAIEIMCCTRPGRIQYDHVRGKFDDGKEFCVNFTQIGHLVFVDTGKNRLLWKEETGESFKAVVAFYEDLLKKCNYGVKEILATIGPKAWRWVEKHGSGVQRLPDVEHALFSKMDSKNQEFWLKKMPDHVGVLKLFVHVTPEIVDMSQFRTARRLFCHRRCEMTDAQLLKLNSVTILLADAPRITAPGLAAFFRRWQRGEGAVDFRELRINHIGVDRRVVELEDVIEALNEPDIETWRRIEGYYSIRRDVHPVKKLIFWSLGDRDYGPGVGARVILLG